MKINLVKLILLYTILNISSAANYCSLCTNHIACRSNGKFSSKCSKDASIVKLTTSNIQTILNAHNEARNLIAGGKVSGFKSATKMMTLKWDSELASLASLNVRQCDMIHDKCRKTQKYPNVGQNLHRSHSSPNHREINSVLKGAVSSWFNEYKITSQSHINVCCGGAKLIDIGHFLQLAQDRAVAVGCAASRYTSVKGKTTLIACNYSFGNMRNDYVYKTGTTASSCPNGRNSVFKNLCK